MLEKLGFHWNNNIIIIFYYNHYLYFFSIVIIALLAKHTLGSFLDDLGSLLDFFFCQLNIKRDPDASKKKHWVSAINV